MNNVNGILTRIIVWGAAALLLLSALVVLISRSVFGFPGVPGLIMIAVVGTVSCILVYHFRPKHAMADDALLEEFKRWKPNNARDGRLRKPISSALWMAAAIVYFLIGFLFPGTWAFSWIIFLAAAAADRIIKLAFELREERHE